MYEVFLRVMKIYEYFVWIVSLKEIEFYSGHLCFTICVKAILPNLEKLKFSHCELDTEVYETFIQYCGNLKRLYVRDNDLNGKQHDIFIGKSNDWLANQYPPFWDQFST